MLYKVLYCDYSFNAVFYCRRSEALAKVSEWIVIMAISLTRPIDLLENFHAIFLCFLCARCHFQTDFLCMSEMHNMRDSQANALMAATLLMSSRVWCSMASGCVLHGHPWEMPLQPPLFMLRRFYKNRGVTYLPFSMTLICTTSYATSCFIYSVFNV